MTTSLALLLASSSPRRRQFLEEAGHRVLVVAPRIDDAGMPVRTAHALEDCASLAWFKAAQVWVDRDELSQVASVDAIIAADTVCVSGDRVFGKPRDGEEARSMILAAIGSDLRVVTGVCLVCARSGERRLFADEAIVRMRESVRLRLDEHIDAGAWRGHAGGFNLDSLWSRGWDIECVGDPTTVVGLPMRVLEGHLARLSRSVAS